MKGFLAVLIFIALPLFAPAQWVPEQLLTNPVLYEKDSNKFLIDADIVGFFKNNEYFSPTVKGETFPGVRILPKVAYQVDNRLRAELGMTGLYYSGDQQKEGTYVFNGIFVKLQYAIKPNFSLIFGNYNGGVNHRLIEPLYRWETHIVGKPESGLQLMYEDDKFFGDVWLNWQRFIERGDSVPEILTFGVSSSAVLSKSTSRLKFSVPFQLVIHHQGGQIDNSDEKMIVAGNMATGLCSEYFIDKKFLKSIGFSLYLAGYYDKLSDKPLRPYSSGFGIYPVLNVNMANFKAMVGYWYADRYFSYEGEPLFASFNPDYPGISFPERSMITAKVSYGQQLHKMLAIGVHIETYTDLKRNETDYSFGLFLRFKYSGIK